MKHSFRDDGDTRKYWAQVPNIVCDIGLKAFELALYLQIKRAAGADDNGKCTKSARTLAKDSGMSVTLVAKAKETLQKPQPEISNKPLIVITEKLNPKGGKPYHEITLTDIWPENINRYTPRDKQVPYLALANAGQVPQNGGSSSIYSASQVPYMDHKKNSGKEEIKQEDSNALFFSSLKTNPAYSCIDIDREVGRMQAWLALPANKGRQCTPRFVLNWLNKVERPLSLAPTNGNGNGHVNRYKLNDALEVCMRCNGTNVEITERGSRPCKHLPL